MRTLPVTTACREQLVDITRAVQETVSVLGCRDGVCHVHCAHTTAGLTINENADPDVVHDILLSLDDMVKNLHGFRHGEGNSAAHVKSALMGAHVSVPVTAGRLALGTWQALYFCEFDGPRQRQVWVTCTPAVAAAHVDAASSRVAKEKRQDAASTTVAEEKRQDAASTLVDAASSRVAKEKRQDAASTLVDAASSRVAEGKRQDAASTTIFRFFDPREPICHLTGNLPHWRQRGAAYFVTFRLADALPQEKLTQWQDQRAKWLASHPDPLSDDEHAEYHGLFTERIHQWLDAGYGACVLAQPQVKKLVDAALQDFNGNRYTISEYIIMPNHVHVIVSPINNHTLSEILHSWKSYTSNKINQVRGRTGTVWQKESFDHIVRCPEQLAHIAEYIRTNDRFLNVDAASSRVVKEKRQDAASTTVAEEKRQDAASTTVGTITPL